MSVRFVIGRAGTGKTHHCLTAIQEELARDPLTGPRLMLLVPEQASLQMERALLSGPVRATARAEVLSFRRLALRILGPVATHRKLLSPIGRAMVLRSLLQRLAGELRYYHRVDRLTGFLDCLGQTIDELIAEGVSPDDLRVSVAGPESGAAQLLKLADVADVYAAYLAYLGDERLDASQYLRLAGTLLAKSDAYRGARIWVDGFAGFTGQELSLLAALAARAEHVAITLLVDPEVFSQVDRGGDIDPAGLFARPLRAYARLREALHEAGCTLAQPRALTGSPPPRFAASADLARVEAQFPMDEAAGPIAESDKSQEDVVLIAAQDRRVEVECAVARICTLTRRKDHPLRYRDIAVICRDLEIYHDLLSAALTERGIPFFIDRRRTLVHHPLVEFVRQALAIAVQGAALDPVRLLLATGLCGLEAGAADELENYLLAHGINRSSQWTGADWELVKGKSSGQKLDARTMEKLARVNRSRRQVAEVLGDLLAEAGRTDTGAGWAARLRALFERAKVEATVATWAERAEGDGEVERAAEHRQALTAVGELLDDLADALADEPLAAEDAARVVEAGLASLTLGLIPPTVDQVLLGSIERSRHPDIKAVIVIGFNDGVFPQMAAEGVVLNDADRDLLADGGVRVGVTHRQRMLDERMLAYVALTRASESLTITWAAADENGRALRPSPYVREVQRAVGGTRVRQLRDPLVSGGTFALWTDRDLIGGLAVEFGGRCAGVPVDPARQSKWNGLYAVARNAERLRAPLAAALAALGFHNDALLDAERVNALIGGTYIASVSELESFAACPFQRYARYGLRLRRRDESRLLPTDMGTVHHAILEAYLNDCLARGEGFAGGEPGEVLDRLARCADEVGNRLGLTDAPTSARDAYLLARSAADLGPIVRRQQRIAAGGAFVPRAAERPYGFSNAPDTLPALAIDTPMGRRVLLRGVIDRVDLAEVGDELLGVVVDYKRTRDKRLDLGQVYHGLSLQLLGYLLALADRGATLAGRPIIPVGAFYVSLLRKYRAVAHPADGGDDADDGDVGQPRGVFDASRLAVLERDAPETGWAKLFKMYRLKSGAPGNINNSDVADPHQFRALLEHTRRRLGELADGVLDGDVSVSPYRLNDFSPCHWCDMRPVCRFEFGDSGMRHLDRLKRTDVLTRIEEQA
jgi:ATP-dependent helicase/nuclease subunit B